MLSIADMMKNMSWKGGIEKEKKICPEPELNLDESSGR